MKYQLWNFKSVSGTMKVRKIPYADFDQFTGVGYAFRSLISIWYLLGTYDYYPPNAISVDDLMKCIL
jgi:hypothetical protein